MRCASLVAWVCQTWRRAGVEKTSSFPWPARRKFLKTDATELAHCIESVRRHALARPDVGFAIWHEGKLVEQWRATWVPGQGDPQDAHDALARRLNDWGFAVRGYDQYGHGESAGPRGGLTSDMRLLDDLADLVDATRARMLAGQPLVLLGHSMGGLVASRFVSLHLRPVDALVLSSPALDAGLGAVQKLLLATLPRIAPNLRGFEKSSAPTDVAAYKPHLLIQDIQQLVATESADGTMA
eukprot:gene398-569_t